MFLLRYLGLREGLATWWQQLGDRPVRGSRTWDPAHGERPSMPGYRRRKAARR